MCDVTSFSNNETKVRKHDIWFQHKTQARPKWNRPDAQRSKHRLMHNTSIANIYRNISLFVKKDKLDNKVISLIKTSPQHAPDFVLSRQNKIGSVLRAGFNQTVRSCLVTRSQVSITSNRWRVSLFQNVM